SCGCPSPRPCTSLIASLVSVCSHVSQGRASLLCLVAAVQDSAKLGAEGSPDGISTPVKHVSHLSQVSLPRILCHDGRRREETVRDAWLTDSRRCNSPLGGVSLAR